MGQARGDTLAEAEEVRSQCHLHTFDAEVLQTTLDLLARYPQLEARDAVHAATAVRAGIGLLLSTDRVFDDVAEVERIDPAAPGSPWLEQTSD